MEEVNLSDSDFYKYIGVTSDSSMETINKNLRQFFIKIHPDKCNLDNLRKIFRDNTQILNLINNVSSNLADKDSDRQSVCTKLYQLFSNKWESLQVNSRQEINEEEGVTDNQYNIETFNDSLNAQFALQLVDFNTLIFYDTIVNYIEANPSATLSQDEINQIMYLLQKFVYDNKDNLFLFKDFPPPQQPLVQKGGSLNILLITLIFIFISSLFVSVQGQFASPDSVTTTTSQSKHENRKQYLSDSSFGENIGNVFKEGQNILEIVSVVSKEATKPTRHLVKQITGSVFDAIGTQVEKYTDKLDSDNFEIRDNISKKIQLKRNYEAQLKDSNNKENHSDLLAKIYALGCEIKKDSVKYSQKVLFKSVINTLLSDRDNKIPESVLFETIKTGVSYISELPNGIKLDTNTNILIVDAIQQIFYRFFSELQNSGVMKIPEKTTGMGIYDSYIRQYIPLVKTFFEQADKLLENIDVSQEQSRWAEKYKSDIVGDYNKSTVLVGTENYLNNIIENKFIPLLASAGVKMLGLHPAVSVSVGVVAQAYSIVNEIDSARLVWGHRIHLAKNVVKSAIPVLEIIQNVRVEGSYEQQVAKLSSTLLDKRFSSAMPIVGSLVYTAFQDWLFPTSDTKIKSAIQVTYINNFGIKVKNPVYKGLIASGKLKVNNGNVSLNDLITSINGFNFDNYSTKETVDFFEFVLKNMEEVYQPTISSYQSTIGIINEPIEYLYEVLELKADTKTNLNKLITNIGPKLIKDTMNIQLLIKENYSTPELGVDETEFNISMSDLKVLGNVLRERLFEYNELGPEYIGGIRYKKYINIKNK